MGNLLGKVIKFLEYPLPRNSFNIYVMTKNTFYIVFILLLIISCEKPDNSSIECGVQGYRKALLLAEKEVIIDDFKEKSYDSNRIRISNLIKLKVVKKADSSLFCLFEKYGVSDKSMMATILFNCVMELHRYNDDSIEKLSDKLLLNVLNVETEKLICKFESKRKLSRNLKILDVGNEVLIILPAERSSNRINANYQSCTDIIQKKPRQLELSFRAVVLFKDVISDSTDVLLKVYITKLSNPNASIYGNEVFEKDFAFFALGPNSIVKLVKRNDTAR